MQLNLFISIYFNLNKEITISGSSIDQSNYPRNYKQNRNYKRKN